MPVREKIELKMKNGCYQVTGLVNRTDPYVGKVLEEEAVQKLILEAKQYGELTVTIK